MAEFSPFRAFSILALISALLVALVGRVAYLQTIGRTATIRQADRQQHQTVTLQARRGSILDANGILMAGTVQTQTLYVDPKFMQDQFQQDGHSLVEMDDAVAKLAKLIGQNPYEIGKVLGDRATSRYVKIAENLDDAAVNAIMKLNLPGVGVTPVDVRYYPMGSLAAHLLGGTSSDGRGLDGLELQFDKELAGHDGFERVLKDARRRAIAVAADDFVPPQHGQHVVTNIDSNIQNILEQELNATCTQFEVPGETVGEGSGDRPAVVS